MPLGADLERAIREHSRRVRDEAVRRLLEALRSTAPVSVGHPGAPTPGRLRDSITTTPTETSSTFGTRAAIGVDYAEFVVKGTQPHEIRARQRGGVLRFWWPEIGGFAHFPHVQHPGTPGNAFWDDALGRWREFLQSAAHSVR